MALDTVSVLVVDDVNAMRVQIKEILKSVGFKKIDLAGDGAEAQTMMAKNAYDMVLSDWHMEPLGGMELLGFVRDNPLYAQTAFIMITAENAKEHVMKAIEMGVDNYLVKPLTVAQIQDKIITTLNKRKGAK